MLPSRDKYVIIVAGGAGLRMGTGIPKQFLEIKGMPVIMHTINRFVDFYPGINIIIVLPPGKHRQWLSLCKKHSFNVPHTLVDGGDERFYSVKNGLKKVPPGSLVAVHDAVRPLVSPGTINRCFTMAEKKGNAVPVCRSPESLRQVNSSGLSFPVNRDEVRLVQTPQVFFSEILLKAYDCGYSPLFTDDATVVEEAGVTINLVEGNSENIKITSPPDLVIAEAFLDSE